LDPGTAEAFPDAEEFEPERWETAIEDFAQVVALGIDRAQDLADVIGDFCSERPGLIKAFGAISAGVVAGMVLARATSGRRRAQPVLPQSPPVPTSSGVAADLAGSLVAIASSLAQELRHQPQGGGAPPAKPQHQFWSGPPRVQMRHVAQLLPVVITMAKNPLIRDLLVSSAVRAARRRQ